MATKSQILELIVRTAKENGGVPLGSDRFRSEIGIREVDWQGKYWARWSDALKEAGFAPNSFQQAYSVDFLMEKLAVLARELGRFPTRTEIQLKTQSDKSFPSAKTFQHRGSKAELAQQLAQFCVGRTGYEDVVALCAPVLEKVVPEPDHNARIEVEILGAVYLLRSGRYYKIGRSNAAGRRERELQIQLPEKAKLVHSISTDDPPGIENYWHRRFEARRKNGEWFELTANDVAAFKRRKFM